MYAGPSSFGAPGVRSESVQSQFRVDPGFRVDPERVQESILNGFRVGSESIPNGFRVGSECTPNGVACLGVVKPVSQQIPARTLSARIDDFVRVVRLPSAMSLAPVLFRPASVMAALRRVRLRSVPT
jgi:hypothetical protein